MKRLFIAVLLIACAIPASAAGSRFNVNCDKGEKINKLLNTIAKAGAAMPITVNVSGTCKESVLIQNFDRLTLQTKTGAVIIGPPKSVNPSVTIAQSNYVTVQGFTIQGGQDGLDCVENSICDLNGLMVENSANGGVAFGRSAGILTNNVFQNNPARGLNLVNGSKVLVVGGTVQGNGADGIGVVSGSNLTIENATIQNNAGDGIRVLLGSALRMFDTVISGNAGNGITLFSQANGSLEQITTGSVVTANTGNGVAIRDVSFARFFDTNNISGNLAQPDIACIPQFAATRGSGTAGGTTDCVEPVGAKPERDSERREIPRASPR